MEPLTQEGPVYPDSKLARRRVDVWLARGFARDHGSRA